MLIELHVTDFAIIDRLTFSPGPGLNVLTGETGAGKSIIMDAVGALLGEKLGPENVRAGAESARVEGVFSAPDAETLSELREGGVDLEADASTEGVDAHIIVGRELHRGGRSVCRLNGRLVPAAVLQTLGQALVDIHGQGEHLSLLRPARHVDFLDRYAGLLSQRAQVAACVTALRSARRQLQSLQSDARDTARRLDLLRYQLDEIRAARLQPAEEEELAAERQRLQNAERIMALADAAYSALYAGGAGMQPASVQLARAAASLRQLSRLDPAATDHASNAEGLSWQAEELARTVRAYRDAVDLDPGRLEQVEERLSLIVGLKRKYGNGIPEILAFADGAAAELDALSHAEETASELEARCAELSGECGRLAADLSAARAQAAARLSVAMEEEMRGLGMSRVRFVVQMRRRPDPDGISLVGEPEPVAVDATGADEVEFLLSPNPGEPPKPLARIASGGETSRLMLAMKSILSAADTVPTLIFDEIDQGVGGRGGRILGQKLWGLARRHQVICVTHLAQIASHGDTHFSITKVVEGDRTVTRVRTLAGEDRVREIADMLGAAGGASRQAAADTLREARAWKIGEDAGAAGFGSSDSE